ncbi:MAG TPA: DUF4139 domain-containing protein [Candidatus Acidoferrales bacterium]|nr:DUF4139 domain-containing protein [Candidatus Acidoferrales bacterium]
MRNPVTLGPLLGLALAFTPAAPASAGPAVTVYTRNLGFVREQRTLPTRGGVDTVRIENVSRQLDFSSVRLVPAIGRVQRLAFRSDVASADGLIDHAIGHRVRVVGHEGHVTEGTLLSADGGWVVLREDDGSVTTLQRSAADAIQIPHPEGSFALRPAIEAVIDGSRSDASAELSYLTGGLSWNAEHVLVRTGETSAIWSATVQVTNSTGRDFVDADLKLVSGDPSRTAEPMPRALMYAKAVQSIETTAGPSDMTESAFSEYHLYTLQHPATLRDRETQSLVLIDPRPVAVTPRYLYRGGDARGVSSNLEIVNSEKAGPGVPLPAGRVRVFEKDDSGSLQFAGEDHIAHVPVGEKLAVDVGYAFDLAAERRVVADQRSSNREREYTVEIRLRNRKPGAVTIRVEETVSGDAQVTKESQPSTRKDATTLDWDVTVPAGQETVLTYTAHQRI